MRILIVVHLYYLEQWSNMIKHLDNIRKNISGYEHDIYISIPEDKIQFKSKVLAYDKNITVIETENNGYDVWPFIKIISKIDLDLYDFIIKLHTKRSMGFLLARFNNTYVTMNVWRNYLFSFIRKRNLSRILNTFNHESKLGMVNSYMVFDKGYINSDDQHVKYCLTAARDLLLKTNLSPTPADEVTYIAGTMFICRAFLLKPLQKLNLSNSDFIFISTRDINDLSHILERFFGWVVTSQGYTIRDCFSSKLDQLNNLIINKLLCFIDKYSSRILRFFFKEIKVDGTRYYCFFKLIKYKAKE